MISIQEGYRAAIIHMLLRLMAIDGHRDRAEYIYILNVAYELGMTPEDIANLRTEDLMTRVPLPGEERERMIILYYLLFMMKTDGDVSASEEMLVKEIGYHLGFRIEMVHDLIQVIKANDISRVPAEQMLDKIRTYLN